MNTLIIFFIVGLVCICTLFASTILLPTAFPIILCIYFTGASSILLYYVRRAQKQPNHEDILTNMQFIHIFNIIISSFFIVILGVLMIPKAAPSYSF